MAEDKILEQDIKFYSEIVKNMAEGVYVVGLNDVLIKYTNPKFDKMFGYKKGEMLGKHASILNAPTKKDPRKTAEEIMEVIRKTGEWHGEVENIKKDGATFWSYANVSVFVHPQYGEVLMAVHSDITGRKQVEEKLKEKIDELEKTNKLMIGREMKMIELKEKIKKLEKKK